MEPSTQMAIFVVGNSETSKAYGVYIPLQGRTMVSRDVRFEKSQAFRKSYEPLPTMAEDKEQEALGIE